MWETLVDIGFGTVLAGLSSLGGWWLRGRSRRHAELDSEKVRLAWDNLHNLAAGMAEDVGQHNSQVREISDELQGDDPNADVSTVVSRLMVANEKLQQRLDTAETRLQQQAREIQAHAADARTDALTGLNNRRAFNDEATRRSAEFQRHGRPVSVVVVDVDHFKKFNDTYGHHAGDAVLKGVAKVLVKTMREMDFVSRYGGEEFAIVCPGTKLLDAKAGAERACRAIEAAKFHYDGTELKVTASMGVAELITGEAFEATIKRADEALYRSKQAGRNCGHYHDGKEMHPFQPKLAPPPKPAPAPAVDPADAEDPNIDTVTKLHTRAVFCQEVVRRMTEWKRGGATVTGMLLKIDHFDALLNDHGDKASQVVLRATTQFIRAVLGEMDHAARYADDTFGVLLPDATVDDAIDLAERIRKAIKRCELGAGKGVFHYTISVGIAQSLEGDDSNRLIARVTEAINHAAKPGNRTVIQHGEECAVVDERSAELVG